MDLSQIQGFAKMLQDAILHFGVGKKAFYSLNGHGHRHEADAEQFKVIRPDMGLAYPNVWVHMLFGEGALTGELRVEQPVNGFGKRNTPCRIWHNNELQKNPAFIVSHRDGLEGSEFYERALAIFEFDNDEGVPQVYRFDIDLATVGV